jgi:hypothetical protein
LRACYAVCNSSKKYWWEEQGILRAECKMDSYAIKFQQERFMQQQWELSDAS